ncbi:hypothetical protein E4U25_000567 [Claviceps purpurea]|nr:hypothetical protein E4U25_000567 [Claviceps purpurea]
MESTHCNQQEVLQTSQRLNNLRFRLRFQIAPQSTLEVETEDFRKYVSVRRPTPIFHFSPRHSGRKMRIPNLFLRYRTSPMSSSKPYYKPASPFMRENSTNRATEVTNVEFERHAVSDGVKIIISQYHPDLSKQATLFSGHNYNIFEILGASFAKEVGSCKETIGDRKVESITIFDKNPSPTRIHPRHDSISDKYPFPTSIHFRQVSISDKYPSPTSIHLRQVSISDRYHLTSKNMSQDSQKIGWRCSNFPAAKHLPQAILDFGYFLLRCSYPRRTKIDYSRSSGT